jgi:Ca-activated chloride channel family protein
MAKRFLLLLLILGLFSGSASRIPAQEAETSIRVVVDLVQLNVAVTDSKGNYVTGLRPQDFSIAEDRIQQKLATFGEGNEPTRSLAEITEGNRQTTAEPRTSSLSNRVQGGSRTEDQ